MLQDIFGVAILVQFGIGGWILCMAAYKIASVGYFDIIYIDNTSFYIKKTKTNGGWSFSHLIIPLKYTFRFQLNVLSIEFASMTLFILCILTELFLYCYYGNELTVEVSAAARSPVRSRCCS